MFAGKQPQLKSSTQVSPSPRALHRRRLLSTGSTRVDSPHRHPRAIDLRHVPIAAPIQRAKQMTRSPYNWTTAGNRGGPPATIQLGKHKTFEQQRKAFRTNLFIKKKRKRHAGDALFGAKERYVLKLKRFGVSVNGTDTWRQIKAKAKKAGMITFSAWKKNREAQHLVPAAVAMKLGISDRAINHPDNLMMLIAGRKGKTKPSAAYQKLKRKKTRSTKLTEPLHIKRGVAHPDYNKFSLKHLSAALRHLRNRGKSKETIMLAVAKRLGLSALLCSPK